MGEVYRARDSKLNRDVAIKVLPDVLALDGDRLARFQREAQLLAALNHPNIAQIYGLEDIAAAGTAGTTAHALVMEFVDGEDLAQRLTHGALPVDEAVAIGAQIADALETAHEQGIIHRDLKPANVKVRPDGTVKVLDFGLAKAMDPTSTLASGSSMLSPTLTARATQIGTIIGTAAYMAPEQARGKAVDRRADVWALGVVLYEMLTGRRAFEGDDVSDTLAAVLRQEIDLGDLPAATPPSLRRLIERCLVRDPRQRLRDIGEARVLLERLRSGGGEQEHPAAASAASVEVAPPASWTRTAIWLACVCAGAAAAAYAAWVLKPQPPLQVTRFAIDLPEDQRFTNPGRKMVAVSPDGTHVAYVANRQIYLRPLSGLETHAIPGTESSGGIHYVVFSPDGQWLAYRSTSDGLLKRIPLAGGAPATISPIDTPYGLTWTDQGILFGIPGKGILRVSPNGGVPEVIAAVGDDEMADAPDLLPGGKALLFSVKKRTDTWDKGQVVVQALDGGTRTTVVDGAADARYVPTGHLVYGVSGVLFAVPFDLGSLSVTGGPVSVLEGVRRLSSSANSTATAHYAFSANGSLVYVPGPADAGSSSTSDLAVFDRNSDPQALKLPPALYLAARVSPDGQWAAFERSTDTETDVWLYELSGTTAVRRLTFGGKNRAPVWSGDSRWLAFQSDRDGDAAIFRQPADGSGAAERLTTPEEGAAHIPQSWSPDNRYLLYTQVNDAKHSLWLRPLDDQNASLFGGVESTRLVEASFSPDGRWVAYSADDGQRTSSLQTYVVPFPPTGSKYLVPIAGSHAFWSRAGDALVLDVGPGTSAVVSVRTRPTFAFGKPETYPRGTEWGGRTWSRRNSDAMPGGRVLGVTFSEPASAVPQSQVRVVLNWFEELRTRVPK